MSTQTAIVIQGANNAQLVKDRPIPKLRDGYVLVKTEAVALNPTDWMHITFVNQPGTLVGCDFSGTVIEVGKNVHNFKKGDAIAGFAHGSDVLEPENGTFAEYIVAKASIQLHKPVSLSFEEASTLGVGFLAAGQALYQSLQLPLPPAFPNNPPQQILIYGGSTASGSLAIQYAKLSGFSVLATSSLRNFDYIRSLGADNVFDYQDSSSVNAIREYTNNGLKLVMDCIAQEASAAYIAKVVAPGATVASLLPVKFPSEDVISKFILTYTALGEDVDFAGTKFPANKEDLEFAIKFSLVTDKLLSEGKIKPHRLSVRPGGLEGVLEGLKDLKEGKVSGQKLVYRISETQKGG